MLIQNTTMSHTEAFTYLQSIKRREKTVSQKRLKIMLAAAIYRGLEEIAIRQFVFDLAKAIGDEYDLNEDLVEAISLVKHLEHQITFSKINEEKISQRLCRILEILTKD